MYLLKNDTSGFIVVQNNVIVRMKFLMLDMFVDERIYNLDQFFCILISESDVTSPEELLDLENVIKLFNRINYLYSKFMTQVINSEKYSTPFYPNPTYNVIIALSITRLKMNNDSKITFQILLTVMFVYESLVYLLIDMRRTLSHNPHTITGSMSLFFFFFFKIN